MRRKLNEIYDDSRYEKTIQAFGYKNIATIHPFQGTENDTVIILLEVQHPLDKRCTKYNDAKAKCFKRRY
ncbi:MAG TPA: hypothetical protein LFW11_01720 [Rickettsia endosymbiont of Proechinophthirus fluctus]|nr:hypothetical protein [Rickettsia endosymbiont of Proechinophthirus fluctus]